MAEQLAVEVNVKNVTEQQYTAVHRTSPFILFGFRLKEGSKNKIFHLFIKYLGRTFSQKNIKHIIFQQKPVINLYLCISESNYYVNMSKKQICKVNEAYMWIYQIFYVK